MSNIIKWIEIPTLDLERAKDFYTNVFGIDFEYVEMPGTKMYIFGNPEEIGTAGALILSKYMKPNKEGSVIYFTCDDIANKINTVKNNKGSVFTPQINVEGFGYYAHVLDSEGNKIGLHSGI